MKKIHNTNNKLKIGIFFGGSSREREISFLGGRTVYDRLDKALYESIPIFVDSMGNFIILEWQFLYKGTIRDFYPPSIQNSINSAFKPYIEGIQNLTKDQINTLIESVGKRIYPHEFDQFFDIAFLVLHGVFGEDGSIQGLLEWYNIPYIGSKILSSALNIDKGVQKKIINKFNENIEKQSGYIKNLGGNSNSKYHTYIIIKYQEWLTLLKGGKIRHNEKKIDLKTYYQYLKSKLSTPFVAKSCKQGSSIGVSIVRSEEKFEESVNSCFFIKKISKTTWNNLAKSDKIEYINKYFLDIRYGIGMPTITTIIGNLTLRNKIYDGEFLLTFIDLFLTNITLNANFDIGTFNKHHDDFEKLFSKLYNSLPYLHPNTFISNTITKNDFFNSIRNHILNNFSSNEYIIIVSENHEKDVIFESYIKGKEFSCIVIEGHDNNPIALPPTELKMSSEIFDYKSKYLPGESRKNTPMEVTFEKYLEIKHACENLFQELYCSDYARIDGFIKDNGEFILNDPNTTSGINPSSFLFHQAAEVGFNPTEFLTYIIKKSLDAYPQKKEKLNAKIKPVSNFKKPPKKKLRVGVIMGGFSNERHVSLEGGRNIFNKLLASDEFTPIPIFLTSSKYNNKSFQYKILNNDYKLFILPINILLKDNADDIHKKLNEFYEFSIKNPSNSLSLLEKDKILKYARSEVRKLILDDILIKNQDYKSTNSSINKTFNRYINESSFDPIQIDLKSLNKHIDFVFIALHGRPGEDGQLQQVLEKMKIPYNGSSSNTCNLTMNKYETNQFLKSHNILISDQILINSNEWTNNELKTIQKIESNISYPLIGKPVDDGCSSNVKKLNNREELKDYINGLNQDKFDEENLNNFSASYKQKEILIEKFISSDAGRGEISNDLPNKIHILEITGGLLTEINEKGDTQYTIFEPSETISSNQVLSLQEKFLAGEGQNITPARYFSNPYVNECISTIVKKELLKVAKLVKIEGYARIDAFVKIDKSFLNDEKISPLLEDSPNTNCSEDIASIILDTIIKDSIEVIIIEINALPAMTPATCIFHQAALAGYTPQNFIKKIIQYGLKRYMIV